MYGHAHKEYYPLEVSFFKTSEDMQVIDVLWKRYWSNTLTKFSLFESRIEYL